jgi:hypothetical protein
VDGKKQVKRKGSKEDWTSMCKSEGGSESVLLSLTLSSSSLVVVRRESNVACSDKEVPVLGKGMLGSGENRLPHFSCG